MDKKHDKELCELAPILYSQRNWDCRQTCMCWGFECGDGWYQLIRNLSVELEILNITIGKKHHYVIQASQVKEKFGTLHFYYDIVHYPSAWRRYLARPFNYLVRKISLKLRPKYEQIGVTLTPIYCNTWLAPFRDMFAWIADFIESFMEGNKMENEVVREYLFDKAYKLTSEAEAECMNYCEYCGTRIGDDHSPRCETTGWITYRCEKCAMKGGDIYIKDGKRYMNGKLVEEPERKSEVKKTSKKTTVKKPN